METITTKRECVRSALNHVQPDVVPWHIDLTAPALDALAQHYADPEIADPTYFNEWVGNHFFEISPGGKGLFHGLEEEVEPGVWRDGWGIVWDTRGVYGEGEWGRPMNCVLTEPSMDNFELPPPPDPSAYGHYPNQIEVHKKRFILGYEGHLFEAAWALRGFETFMMDMVLHPAFVDDLMEAITTYYLAVIDESLKYDIDGFVFGEDWGSQNSGLMMGPDHWRRFIKPYLARMFQPIKDAGKCTYVHSDGQVDNIFPDLIEIGLDIYNPFQPEIMDVYRLKETYGDQLAFHGGIGVQDLLMRGAPEEVQEEVLRMIDKVGAGGGYILAPAHSVLADTPVENIAAMIDTLRAQ